MVTSKPGQQSEQSSAAPTGHSKIARGWRIARFLPIFEWLPRYGRDNIAGDLMAGAVVAIMLVPQSMASRWRRFVNSSSGYKWPALRFTWQT